MENLNFSQQHELAIIKRAMNSFRACFAWYKLHFEYKDSVAYKIFIFCSLLEAKCPFISLLLPWNHRDCIIHIERESLAVVYTTISMLGKRFFIWKQLPTSFRWFSFIKNKKKSSFECFSSFILAEIRYWVAQLKLNVNTLNQD